MNVVKISFYFTLWICAWIFIELLGVPAGFSFWCAFILVLIFGKVIEVIFSKSIENQQYQEKILRWEQIFRNDKEAYIREKKKQIPIESLWLTYLILSLVGFVCIGGVGLAIYVIFLYFAAFSGYRIFMLVNSVSGAKREETLEETAKWAYLNSNSKEWDMEGYKEFYLRRSQGESLDVIMQDAPKRSFKTIMLISSSLAVFLGYILLLGSLRYLFPISKYTPSAFSGFLYGGFAMFWGIKDLLDENRNIALSESIFGTHEELPQMEENTTKWKKFKHMFSFKGRIGRSVYLGIWIIYVICYTICRCLEDKIGESIVFAALLLLMVIPFIFVFWLFIAQGAKRCHDINYSGWFQLVPCWTFVLLLVKGSKGRNKYDTVASPSPSVPDVCSQPEGVENQ